MKWRRRPQIRRGTATDRLARWEDLWRTALHSAGGTEHNGMKQYANDGRGDDVTQIPRCELPQECRPVRTREDLLPEYRGTPIEDLFAYHNFGASFRRHTEAELLIGTCMDSRIWLRIPPDFALELRVGGANLRGLEFQVSLAIALRGVSSVCLIGHDDCAMTGMKTRQAEFIRGLVENGGWNRRYAQRHFKLHTRFEIEDTMGFVRTEALRLSQHYPRIVVAPLFYSVVNRALYQVDAGMSEHSW